MVAGLQVNKWKSVFIKAEDRINADIIVDLAGFEQAQLPFQYLGAPIYTGRPKMKMFLVLKRRSLRRLMTGKQSFINWWQTDIDQD